MVKRVLIVTALEETWPDDSTPVVFLGEWARLYSRKSLWSKMDAEVVPYHWDDREKFRRDYFYLKGLYETVLIELSTKLNEVHAVDHDVQYWRILVGPWLGYFIQMLFDRWYMLDYALKNFNISSVYSLEQTAENVVPQNMEHFQKMFVDDYWNESVYSQILHLISSIPILVVGGSTNKNPEQLPPLKSAMSFKAILKGTLRRGFEHLFKIMGRNDKLFMLSSYLSFKNSFFLQLRLKQIPKFWSAISAPTNCWDDKMRNFILEKSPQNNDFEKLLRILLIKNIPLLYLEGYKGLYKEIQKSPWPHNPEFIFTSNCFLTDDVFKAWVAEKIEKGSKFLVGQHGGNFGTALFGFVEEHQISISDTFISWGWNNKNRSNIAPLGNFVLNDKTQKWDNNGQLLLVTMGLPRYSYHLYSVPLASQFINYQEDQYRFVKALPLVIRSKLLIRLSKLNYRWYENERWNTRFPGIRLDQGEVKLSTLISTSRIYVSTYNATTFLESLTLNVPTIMFWNPKHWELDEQAIPYFCKLKEAGIFHESPESAASKVVKIWDDVAGWWAGNEVQDARKYFCDQFSREIQNPITKLNDIFKNVSKE